MGCAIVSSARAEWLPNGNPICRVPESLEAPVTSSAFFCPSTCAGTMGLFWQDARHSYGSIYRSAVSDVGAPPTGPGDIPASLVRQIDGIAYPVAAVTVPRVAAPPTQLSSSATILVWAEAPNLGTSQIRAQRLDDLVDWGPDGVLVSGDTPGHSSVSVVPDDSGGVFVAWLSRTSTRSSAYVQRIDAYGNVRFGANGIFLGPDTTVHLAPVLERDYLGGCYVARAARDSLTPIGQASFVDAIFHLDRNGAVSENWPAEGIRSIGFFASRLVAAPTPYPDTPNGEQPPGVWVIGDARVTLSDNSVGSMPRVTRLDLFGTFRPGWTPAGIPLLSGREGDVRLEDVVLGREYDLYVLANSLQRVPVLGPTLEDEIVQRISWAGGIAPGWPAQGVAACDAPGRQAYGRMIPAEEGVLCTWTDSRSDLGDIYASKIRANGQLAAYWPANGLQVCGAPGFQYRPVLAPNTLGGAFIAWLDQRDFASHQDDLYAQTVTGDARLDAEEERPQRFRVAGVSPNPARSATRIQFDLSEAGEVQLDVLDIAGRRVHGERAALPAGRHSLSWTLQDASGARVAPGVYLARIRAAGHEGHARVLVTR